jgi:hypothetical protein
MVQALFKLDARQIYLAESCLTKGRHDVNGAAAHVLGPARTPCPSKIGITKKDLHSLVKMCVTVWIDIAALQHMWW